MPVDFAFPRSLPRAGWSGLDTNRREAKMESQTGFITLKTNAFEEFVERKLHPDVKITKVSEAGGNFIEAHFVNDVLNFNSVFG